MINNPLKQYNTMSRYNGWNNNSHKLDGIGGNEPFLNSKNNTMKQDSKPVMSNTADKHTPGNIFLDIGDFDRTGEPNEIFIRATIGDEIFDICGFGCNETNFAKDYATALVTSFNQAPTLKKENEELKQRNRVLVEALQNIQQIENGAFGLKAFDVVRLKTMISEALQSNQ